MNNDLCSEADLQLVSGSVLLEWIFFSDESRKSGFEENQQLFLLNNRNLGGGFRYFFIFIPTWGRFPF